MSLWMGIYAMRQLGGLRREGRLAGGILPLVHSAVIHTGDGSWTAARSTTAITADLGGESWEAPIAEYLRLAAGEVDVDSSGLAGNKAAAILRLIFNRDVKLWRPLAADAVDSLAGPEALDVRRACLVWLEEWVPERFPGEQLWDLSELQGKELERWEKMKEDLMYPFRQKFILQGREEGLEQGLKLGLKESFKRSMEDRRQLLVRLACKRFDDLRAGKLRSLLDQIGDSGKLDEAGDWILSCESGSA